MDPRKMEEGGRASFIEMNACGGIDEHIDSEGHIKPVKSFVPSRGLTSKEAEDLLKFWGPNEIEEKKTPKWKIFISQLNQPMPIMLWIAALVEGAIQNWPDMGILLMIQFVNASLGYYETTKAGDAVAALKASLKPSAFVRRDGKNIRVDAALLVPGDLICLGK